jgi:uncharacterized protein YjiS (DUF1127 family)
MQDMLTIELSEGRTVQVRGGAGGKVTAHAGLLWITEQDWPADVVLLPGQTHVLARPGLAVVQACSEASLSIAPAARAPRSMRDTNAMVAKIPFENRRVGVQSHPTAHEPLEWAMQMTFGWMRGWLGRARAALRAPWAVWTASRTRAQLSALSDHTLRDIGIDRAQIDSLFR